MKSYPLKLNYIVLNGMMLYFKLKFLMENCPKIHIDLFLKELVLRTDIQNWGYCIPYACSCSPAYAHTVIVKEVTQFTCT